MNIRHVVTTLLLLCAVSNCGGATPDDVALPSGPAEILARVESHETGKVYFAIAHSWEELETNIAAPLRGKPFGIGALEMDTNPGAGAPWVKPYPAGTFAPVDGCLRVVQP